MNPNLRTNSLNYQNYDLNDDGRQLDGYKKKILLRSSHIVKTSRKNSCHGATQVGYKDDVSLNFALLSENSNIFVKDSSGVLVQIKISSTKLDIETLTLSNFKKIQSILDERYYHLNRSKCIVIVILYEETECQNILRIIFSP